MPVIDLGSVVGPTGATGATGATGPQGIQGNPGPNQVTANTSTTLNGILKGDGNSVSTATVDSTPNSSHASNLISSKAVADALAKEILFYPSKTVQAGTGEEILRIPASGTDSAITADTVLLRCEFEDPRYIRGGWSWHTEAGFFSITGTCTNSTTANVVLGRKGN